MTSGYPDWLRAFLLLGQHAGTYLPVLLGADGSLYCVLQGDYLGSPMPIKIDEDGQLYMYITDVPDQFGNRSNIGIGELAARIVGWPVSYDRRGQIMFLEQFDSGWGNFRHAVVGAATVELDPQYALQGGYCVHLATPADDAAQATTYASFPLSASTTSLGLSIFFRPSGTYTDLRLYLDYNLAPAVYLSGVKLVLADKSLWVRTGEDTWTQVGSWTPNIGTVSTWYYLKLVIDLATHMHRRIILHGAEIDVSAYALGADTATYSHLYVKALLSGAAGGAGDCLLDCITLTTQEP